MIGEISNPELVRAYYSFDPKLDGISLHEISVNRDGPTLTIRFDLTDFPDKPPEKWHPAYNTAQMTLSLFGIEGLSLSGFKDTEIGNLHLTQNKNKIDFLFKSNTCELAGRCSFIAVEKITAYQNTES